MKHEDLLFRTFELECNKAQTNYLYELSTFTESSNTEIFQKYTNKISDSFKKLSDEFHKLIGKRTNKLAELKTDAKVEMKYNIRATNKNIQKNLDKGFTLINEIEKGKATDEKVDKFCKDATKFVVKNGQNIVASSVALADIITAEKDLRRMEKQFDDALRCCGRIVPEQRSKAKRVCDNMKNNILTGMRLIKVSSNNFK